MKANWKKILIVAGGVLFLGAMIWLIVLAWADFNGRRLSIFRRKELSE